MMASSGAGANWTKAEEDKDAGHRHGRQREFEDAHHPAVAVGAGIVAGTALLGRIEADAPRRRQSGRRDRGALGGRRRWRQAPDMGSAS